MGFSLDRNYSLCYFEKQWHLDKALFIYWWWATYSYIGVYFWTNFFFGMTMGNFTMAIFWATSWWAVNKMTIKVTMNMMRLRRRGITMRIVMTRWPKDVKKSSQLFLSFSSWRKYAFGYQRAGSFGRKIERLSCFPLVGWLGPIYVRTPSSQEKKGSRQCSKFVGRSSKTSGEQWISYYSTLLIHGKKAQSKVRVCHSTRK